MGADEGSADQDVCFSPDTSGLDLPLRCPLVAAISQGLTAANRYFVAEDTGCYGTAAPSVAAAEEPPLPPVAVRRNLGR